MLWSGNRAIYSHRRGGKSPPSELAARAVAGGGIALAPGPGGGCIISASFTERRPLSDCPTVQSRELMHAKLTRQSALTLIIHIYNLGRAVKRRE